MPSAVTCFQKAFISALPEAACFRSASIRDSGLDPATASASDVHPGTTPGQGQRVTHGLSRGCRDVYPIGSRGICDKDEEALPIVRPGQDSAARGAIRRKNRKVCFAVLVEQAGNDSPRLEFERIRLAQSQTPADVLQVH